MSMLNSDMTYGKHCQEQKVNLLTTVKKVEPVIGIGGRSGNFGHVHRNGRLTVFL